MAFDSGKQSIDWHGLAREAATAQFDSGLERG